MLDNRYHSKFRRIVDELNYDFPWRPDDQALIRVRPPQWYLHEVKSNGWPAIPSTRLQKNIKYWDETLKSFVDKQNLKKRHLKCPPFIRKV
jgi:hypothetical protein